MQLYQTRKNVLEPIERDSFKLERDIQSLVESNLETIFGLQFVSSEFPVAEFRIDTVAYDEERNAFVLIEYKRGTNYSVVDQGYSYLSAMVNNKAEFILEYNEKLDQSLKRSEIDWTSSKVIFVSPSFSTYQRNSINFSDVPFELWEIRKFENGMVALEQIESRSNESIERITKANSTSAISKITQEVRKSVTEADHINPLDDDLKELWMAFRERLEQLPDTSFYAEKSYIGARRQRRAICLTRFQKKQLRVSILRGTINPDGKRSKGFFTLDDPKGFAEEISWNRKSGRIGHDYILKIKSPTDLDYAMYLINQKHKSIV